MIDDDFADFQAAPVFTTPAPAAVPAQTAPKPNLMALLNAQPLHPATTAYAQPQQQQPPNYGAPTMGMGGHRQTPSLSTPGFYGAPQQAPQQQGANYFGGSAPMRPMSSFSPPQAQAPAAKPAAAPAKSSNFDDLWSLSLGGSTTAKPAAAGPNKSIKDLEKEKATAGLWGQQKPVGGVPPSAFGSFGNGAPASSSGGVDDLLL